jgi:DNA-binding NarL/FixJ family response regulator
VTVEEPELRVVVADDHPVYREGLAMVLGSLPGVTVVGEASDGDEAVSVAERLVPDVVLMDLSMPGMDGVTATRRISETHRDVAVLVLTSYSDQQRVLEAMDAGAIGYVLKDTDPVHLLAAIRSAAGGDSPLDPRVARTILHTRRVAAPAGELTDREEEVLTLVGQGMANKQIARALGIREGTVKAHLTSVFQRIGVHDRTSAALWARSNLPRFTEHGG